MFEKIYKSAVILIAVFLIGLSIYFMISPSKAISQVPPVANYVVPESHVWDVVANPGDDTITLLYNKKNGECYRITYDNYVSNWNFVKLK